MGPDSGRFGGVGNRVGIDLRTERDAFITDKNTRCGTALTAPTFNEAPYFALRLTAERTGRVLGRLGSGHLVGSMVVLQINLRARTQSVKRLKAQKDRA